MAGDPYAPPDTVPIEILARYAHPETFSIESELKNYVNDEGLYLLAQNASMSYQNVLGA